MTRSGVQATTAGRPVDVAVPKTIHMPEVSSLMQPLPQSVPVVRRRSIVAVDLRDSMSAVLPSVVDTMLLSPVIRSPNHSELLFQWWRLATMPE